MALYPILRLTTGPDATAPVLLDLASGAKHDVWTRHASQGFSLGEPEWQSGPLGMVEGTREISLPVMIDGSVVSRDSHLAALSTALLRPHRSTYLMWQLSEAQPPTWFRLHRASASTLDLTRTFTDPSWRSTYMVPVKVTADGWGIGTRVDLPTRICGAQQAQQGVELPTIQGTAPAPLVLDVRPGPAGWSGWQQIVNVTAVQHDSDYRGSRFWWADQFWPSAGVVQNGRSMTWDESLSTGADGGEVMGGAAPDPVAPGQYRILVLARHAGNNAGGGWLKAGTKYFGSWTVGNWTPWTYAQANDSCWVDCGIINLPSGSTTTRDMRVADMVPPEFTVRWRWNGTDDGLVRAYAIDGLMIIPAGEVSGSAGMPGTFAPKWGFIAPDEYKAMRIDSENQRVQLVEVLTGKVVDAPPALPDGGWLSVTPDARNYLTVLHRVNPGAAGSGTAHSAYSWISGGHYYPRYLHTAGVR